MAGNTTVIVIAHRLSTVRDADCVVVMADGCVVEKGTYQELLDLNGVFRNLVARQLAGGAGRGEGKDE